MPSDIEENVVQISEVKLYLVENADVKKTSFPGGAQK